MPVPAPQITSTHSHRVWWVNFLAILTFWGAYVAIQTSLPAVNEPHYLCKAKHFWQPDYCPGDFFLDSSNAHYVFYAAFGWMTTFLSLETTALIGRSLGLVLLSAGWTSLVVRVSNVAWAPIGSAALFLGVTSWQNFSGEWIVGGFESKVIAYGCLFLSWSACCDRSWSAAALWMGVGISFHPVVGGWSLLSTLFPLAMLSLHSVMRRNLPSRREAIRLGGLMLLLSLPGLIPAVSTVLTSVPEAAAADRLQVFERLGHHLNPVLFPPSAYAIYGALVLLFLIGMSVTRTTYQCADGEESTGQVDGFCWLFWTGLVIGSIVIAFAGLVIGWLEHFVDSQLLVTLMKFYPFRLADVLLPMADAVAVVNFVKVRARSAPWLTGPVLVGCLSMGYVALTLDMPSRNPEKHSRDKLTSWIDICEWVDENLPADAVVVAPATSTTFHWYASRAAYVTFKDCPQDAAGILEWDRRIRLYKSWASRSYRQDHSYSEADLAELARMTGAGYLIANRMGPMEIDPIHRNRHYRVYRLPQMENREE